MQNNLYALILAGGQGTRFWPLSRRFIPKQFLKIAGTKSLIQSTFHRINKLIPAKNIFIITGYAHKKNILKHLKTFSLKKENVILEKSQKNTAAAIGLAAIRFSLIDKNAIMIVLPADHLIKDENKFLQGLKKAYKLSNEGSLITLGIVPTRPDINYGYIKIKSKIRKHIYFDVEKFIEKPNQVKALKFFKDKRFYWNSGIFVWKVSAILEEIRKFMPRLYEALISKKDWDRLSPISIDKGVLEKSKKIRMLPLKCQWSDLGNLSSLDLVLKKDSMGNIFRADSVDIGSNNLTIFSDKRLVATVGLNNLIIIDMPDVLLVCSKEKIQKVRQIIDILKRKRRKEHLRHINIKRIWKNYPII